MSQVVHSKISCAGTCLLSPLTHYIAAPHTPNWVEAIGVVSFDLELGQKLTHLFPPLLLSIRQETDLAFLCFPDTNFTGYGSSLHHFIFPFEKRGCDVAGSSPYATPQFQFSPEVSGRKEMYCDSVLQRKVCSEEYFGSSYYLQRRDSGNKRGAQQKALVILSLYSFPRIFEMILKAISEDIFNSCDTEVMLQSVFDDLSTWPSPLPLRKYTGLCILGKLLGSFSTPYYTIYQTGFCWGRDDFDCKGVNCYAARLRLLEALEDPCRDQFLVNCLLKCCVSGSTAIVGLAAFIKEKMGLSFDVSTWRECDYIAFIEAVRFCMYEDENYALLSEINGGEHTTNSTEEYDVASVIHLFRPITYALPEVLAIHNKELRYFRKLAERFLNNDSDSSKDNSGVRKERQELFYKTRFFEFDIYTTFFPHLNRLWKLWELLITGEPLCILGSSLRRVSAACLCLYSLTAPLFLRAFVRPYVTINSSELDIISSGVVDHLPVIVGATNPFFLRHWVNWPHVICLGSIEEEEKLQTHKTLPCLSRAKCKHQSEIRANMFTSKSFLIRTEKHVWDDCVGNKLRSETHNLFIDDGFANTTCYESENNKLVCKTFFDLTTKFMLPLECIIDTEFEEKIFLYFYDNYVPPNVVVFSALKKISSTKLPRSLFKHCDDMFTVYKKFMETQTYKCWLKQRISSLKRSVVLRIDSLRDFIIMEPNASRRYATLMCLQDMLCKELRKPFLDVVLIRKLLQLTKSFESIRSALLLYGANK